MKDPLFFDAHSHVNFEAFEQDYKEVIQRAFDNDTWITNVSTQVETAERAIAIAHEYGMQGVYAAVGFHPTHVLNHQFDKAKMLELARDTAVVAIGEVGLDYYRMEKDSKPQQEQVFRDMIDVAIQTNKPLIVHCRDAYDDLYDILKEYSGVLKNVVIHCFVGDDVIAKKFVDLGFYISFTGIITFTDNSGLLKAGAEVPNDRFMVETDCPYLTPVPHRGKRNEPMYVRFVAAKIAELKGLDLETVAKYATDNARRFFQV